MLTRTVPLGLIALAASILPVSDASALAQRTFVASYGNDANACTLTSPCRAFAAAIALTADYGEVIVLDSAGYGQVTIKQNVKIIAPSGVYAGITVPAAQIGVHIDDPQIHVVLRGLTINGIGPDTYGIRVTQGFDIKIENCVVTYIILAFQIRLNLSLPP